ncbi:dTDP-4-dehydrorhamnose reductase [Lachnospiraceae bacterium YSD2013]|jgi:dTDP-4-dehydrorhamnose reductase|nr:dTDP-4-dehydrorhamnose reductase [Lachnospiraceae bacterium]MBR5762708.1 dTDP-4-dehydrorhamnose reductase [Lachnospiraceae bacterium]MBR5992808.1 dTDP-4-dehydrorhamnose reductase [Lachnospiraceae bacterium]SCX20835.1 dTDP-4-dehydrorhamnose reductase [Lachnospiraceae bacterium YSD2013]
MKVLVTGVKGQLGYDVMRELAKRNIEGIGVDIDEMDITDPVSVDKVITEAAPDAVIHCAAWTAVDAAEDEDKKEKVRLVNVEGPRNIAKVCKKLDIKMIQISTDYVFDGQGERPWEPDDPTGPVSVYGLTKRDGENAVMEILDKFFIVRIAWVFGINGKNFVKTMLNLSKTHDSLTVVNDQWGSPTYTYDLARLLVDMVLTDKYGIYHATNEGFINWYDFAVAIFKEAGITMNVKPVTTAEYGVSKAARPFNSRMSKDKLDKMGFKRLPSWEDALKRYMVELKENGEL